MHAVIYVQNIHRHLGTHLRRVWVAGRWLEVNAAEQGAKAQPGACGQPVAIAHVELRLRAVPTHEERLRQGTRVVLAAVSLGAGAGRGNA